MRAAGRCYHGRVPIEPETPARLPGFSGPRWPWRCVLARLFLPGRIPAIERLYCAAQIAVEGFREVQAPAPREPVGCQPRGVGQASPRAIPRASHGGVAGQWVFARSTLGFAPQPDAPPAPVAAPRS